VSVETFANVSKLEQLDLSYNNLKSLDINILKVLPKLSHLYLEKNKINEILPEPIASNSLLNHLDLDDNKTENFGKDVFFGMFNLRVIYLKGNKLQFLNLEKFLGLPNLQSLYLSSNRGLQVPTNRQFINSLSLKKLEISSCKIRSVSVKTFANVSELEWLDLSYNYLKNLDINILNALPKLSHLYLKSNQISEIIPGILEKNSFLEYLDLQDNIIDHLRSDVFNGLVNLRYVNLKYNQLQYLQPETFVGLPYFALLDLSLNFGLQILTKRLFISSQSLKYLDISGCNVSSVSVESFAKVSALQLLALHINNLKGLDVGLLKALPQLSKLFLHDNPLQCDCQLQEVWRWCKDHNIQTEYELIAPECDTPSEVKGLWWGVLEKGQCLQGNIEYHGDYKDTRYSYTQIEETDMDTDTKTDLNTESVMWESFRSFLHYYRLPIHAVLFIFGTTGNVILIIIITCNKDMRTVPNMYILNLAIGDIIYLTIIFLRNFGTWYNVDILCVFMTFCLRMSIILTAFSIAVFSFQRYRVTVYPLQVCVSSQPTWRATGATICGLWIVAALFAIPSALTVQSCEVKVYLWFTKYNQHVAIFRLLVSCVLPLCVIAFCYVMTSRHLLKTGLSLSETHNARQNTRKTTAKVVLGLTVVFLFTSVPFHVYETYMSCIINVEKTLVEIVNEGQETRNLESIWHILYVFLSINSCLNPVALFCTSLAFRRYLKLYLTCCCKTKSPPTDFELRRRN
jgi:Leucine-rich repeat (LRR) protein